MAKCVMDLAAKSNNPRIWQNGNDIHAREWAVYGCVAASHHNSAVTAAANGHSLCALFPPARRVFLPLSFASTAWSLPRLMRAMRGGPGSLCGDRRRDSRDCQGDSRLHAHFSHTLLTLPRANNDGDSRPPFTCWRPGFTRGSSM